MDRRQSVRASARDVLRRTLLGANADKVRSFDRFDPWRDEQRSILGVPATADFTDGPIRGRSCP